MCLCMKKSSSFIYYPNYLWFFVLIGVMTLVYVPDMGGSGLRLPLNLMTWGVMSLVIMCASVHVWRHGWLRLSPGVGGCILAAILLTLPWFWTPLTEWRQASLTRLAGIWGSLAVIVALLQWRIAADQRQTILTAILLCIALQLVTMLVQMFLPETARQWMEFNPLNTGWRPYGIFQQVNLAGSWLATGTGIAGLLILCSASEGSATLSRGRYAVLAGLLSAMWVVLIWVQSRTGILGGALMFLINSVWCLTSRLLNARRVFFLLSLPVIAGVTVGFVLPVTPFWPLPDGLDLVHDDSSRARLWLLAGTWDMIRERPFSGWGLGSFETTWPRVLNNTDFGNFTHPHNEILYAWVEGGLAGLAGMLCLAGVWLWPAEREEDGYRKGGKTADDPLAYPGRLTALSVPLVVHMMTEYPFYQSVPHLLLLLLLTRLAWPEGSLRAVSAGSYGRYGMLLPAAGALLVLGLAGGGLLTQYRLTVFERSGLTDGTVQASLADSPWWLTLTQATRLDYDWHVRLLLNYNVSRNPEYLNAYIRWGQKYLTVHNDASVSLAMMQAALLRHDMKKALLIRDQARRVFPQDIRFQ